MTMWSQPSRGIVKERSERKRWCAATSRRKCRDTAKGSVRHEVSSLARSRSAHHLCSVEAKPPPYRGAVG
jgi:hypothetical protein